MKKTQTFGIQLILRQKNKTKESGIVYARVTVNGKCTEISTKIEVKISSWDHTYGKLKGTDIRSRQINQTLEELKGKLMSIYQDMRIRGESITTELIKNHFLGINEEKETHTLVKLLEYHYESQKMVLSYGTIKHYKTGYKYLKTFIK